MVVFDFHLAFLKFYGTLFKVILGILEWFISMKHLDENSLFKIKTQNL